MFGPVFIWEFVRSARRRWHWWLRVLYIGLLLMFLYVTFDDHTSGSLMLPNHRAMAEIGAQFYSIFSYIQLLAVLIIAPIYAATSVCEEKTRRTLPYLLASRLTDAEIVFAKIGLAVLRVWEVLLCGLPLCAICLLLGGVTPAALFLDFLVAITAAWATCALAVLAAICSRRLVEGLLLVVLAQMLWYILPIVDIVARAAGTGFYVPSLLLDMNAFRAIAFGQMAGATNPLQTYFATLTATAACGLACTLAAWYLLRPAWRREEERGPLALRFAIWRRRAAKAKRVWDDPLLWRELRSRHTTAVDRIVAALYLIISVGVLTSIALNWEATVAALRSGTFPAAPPVAMIVAAFSLFLYLAFLALPYLTITGAAAFSEERDGNQFELLRVTLLEQRQLIFAKAARLLRTGLGILMLPLVLEMLIWGMGWATWPALVLTALHCLAAGAFWSMLGMAVGLRMAKTSQAIVVSLVALSAAGLFVPWVAMMIDEERLFAVALCSPPAHCMFLQVVDNHVQPGMLPGDMTLRELRGLSIFYTWAYATGAVAMLVWALQPADAWLSGRQRPPKGAGYRHAAPQSRPELIVAGPPEPLVAAKT